VFLALTWVLDGAEGDHLEHRLALLGGDIEAVENRLVDSVGTGLEIRLDTFEVLRGSDA